MTTDGINWTPEEAARGILLEFVEHLRRGSTVRPETLECMRDIIMAGIDARGATFETVKVPVHHLARNPLDTGWVCTGCAWRIIYNPGEQRAREMWRDYSRHRREVTT
jgi:hypothetical protein